MYVYFIYFRFSCDRGDGYGNTELALDWPIRSIGDVRHAEGLIRESDDFRGVHVVRWELLRRSRRRLRGTQ